MSGNVRVIHLPSASCARHRVARDRTFRSPTAGADKSIRPLGYTRRSNHKQERVPKPFAPMWRRRQMLNHSRPPFESGQTPFHRYHPRRAQLPSRSGPDNWPHAQSLMGVRAAQSGNKRGAAKTHKAAHTRNASSGSSRIVGNGRSQAALLDDGADSSLYSGL